MKNARILKQSINGGELTRNINQKKKSVAIVVGESISSISMWNIKNKLGKHIFFVIIYFLWAGSR